MRHSIGLTAEQEWQSIQGEDNTFTMRGKDNLGIEVAAIGEMLFRLPTPSGFWKRIWMKLFGPRPPATFFVAVQRPPNTAVEVSALKQVRARDDPRAWTDLTVTFRFVPEERGGR